MKTLSASETNIFCFMLRKKNGEKTEIINGQIPYISITIFHHIFNMVVFLCFKYDSFFFVLDSSLRLEDKRKTGFVSSGYKADDEASDDGELPCSKGVGVLKFPFKYLYSFLLLASSRRSLVGVQREKRRAKK